VGFVTRDVAVQRCGVALQCVGCGVRKELWRSKGQVDIIVVALVQKWVTGLWLAQWSRFSWVRTFEAGGPMTIH